MIDVRSGRNPIHAIRGTVAGPGGTLAFTYCREALGVEQEGLIEPLDFGVLVRLSNEYPEAYHPQLSERHLCRECAKGLGRTLP